ncbi:MAG: phosphotransferase [Candidatus Micrarchaeota archaeon]
MEKKDIDILVKDGGFALAETHISWVLLGHDFVFKIKKPVKFSFLDFSTLEKRRFFCEEEVRLNRRLAPEVYLGVVPITAQEGGSGAVGFGGHGRVVDYAVKMARLDQNKMMDRLLAEGKISEEDVRRLAAKVAAFHEKAERVKGDYNSPKTIGAQVADLGNFRDTIEKAAGLGRSVDLVLERSAGFIMRSEGLLHRRIAEGRVRDCHGDLHSGNIFFDGDIRIIDCIEFSRDFRCIDVASDIAFMAMDLDFAERDDLSDSFVDEYISRSGDRDIEALITFYKCYRANVRAKIAAIDWTNGQDEAGRMRIIRYMDLAESYAKRLSI